MYSYFGYCQTQLDCLILFEAAKQGLIPKRKDRLSLAERDNITSGAIFIWDEQETGIRRWTDGKFWSTSRVLCHFLVYRELDNIKKSVGSSGCRIKPYGLCKQATNIMNDKSNKIHLIGYYSKRDVRMGRLLQPSMDPKFQGIVAGVKLQLLKKENQGGQDYDKEKVGTCIPQGSANSYGSSFMAAPLSPPDEWRVQSPHKTLESTPATKSAVQAATQSMDTNTQIQGSQFHAPYDLLSRLTPPLQSTEGSPITQQQTQELRIHPSVNLLEPKQIESSCPPHQILPQPKSDKALGTLAEDRRVLQLLDRMLALS